MKNLTPLKYVCFAGLGCPAVYATESGTLILVGRRLSADDPRIASLATRAPDEEIIEIPADLLAMLDASSR